MNQSELMGVEWSRVTSFDGIGIDAEVDYVNRLDDAVREAASLEHMTLSGLVRRCRGAWPHLVAERLTCLDLWHQLEQQVPALIDRVDYVPELHPQCFEWYFSAKSARDVLCQFIPRQSFSLLLGTPTVARYAGTLERDFVLVDNNPLLPIRFPEFAGKIILDDVERFHWSTPRPACVVLDPPWYLSSITSWLARASQVASPGASIVMPLFQELTRPSATADRALVLRLADRVGPWSIVEDAIEYDIPPFEYEALMATGVRLKDNWRLADLLIIEAKNIIDLQPAPCQGTVHERDIFVIGQQVIHLRRFAGRNDDFLLRALREYPSYILDTVSARNPARARIDVWSSRNRVAEAGDVDRLSHIFQQLSSLGLRPQEIEEALWDVCRGCTEEYERVATFLSLTERQ